MACRCDNLAFTSTLVTLLLELLDEARHDLLFLDDYSLATALWACANVIRVIASRASAMGANALPVVHNLLVCSRVDLLQGHPHLH